MLVSLTGCFTSGVIDRLGMGAVPYVVLLVVPVLGRMSDQCEDVRLMATYCFATLIRLMPLEVFRLTCSFSSFKSFTLTMTERITMLHFTQLAVVCLVFYFVGIYPVHLSERFDRNVIVLCHGLMVRAPHRSRNVLGWMTPLMGTEVKEQRGHISHSLRFVCDSY